LAGGRVAEQESSVEDVFTQELAFYGGSFLVLSGPGDEALFILCHLVRALFLHPEPFPHPSFPDEARVLITAVLALGDVVVRRAALGRGVDPVPFSPSGDVIIPSRHRLNRLKRAVTFDGAALAAVLATRGVHPRALDAATMSLAGATSGDTGANLNRPDALHARPVVATGNARIIVAPHALLDRRPARAPPVLAMCLIRAPLGCRDEAHSQDSGSAGGDGDE